MLPVAIYSGTARGPLGTGKIWSDLPRDINDTPDRGFYFFDDFKHIPPTSTSGNIVGYEQFADAGGTILSPATAIQGGGLQLIADDDNEQVAIGPGPSKAFFNSAAAGRVWFESEVKVNTIADTTFGAFLGLIEANAVATQVPVADAGTLADVNFLGFHRLEADGDKFDIVYKADGQTQQTLLADAITLVADTYIRVGFKFDPNEPISRRIKFYANGVDVGTYVTKAMMDAVTFPDDVQLGLCFGIGAAAGSSVANATIKWWALAQEYI